MKTTTFGTEKDIVVASEQAFCVGVIVDDTGVSADSDGRKIIKAGTPVGASDDVLKERDTVLSVVADATAQGVLRHDVDVTDGQNNATLIVDGKVDLLKIDETTRALITDTIEGALPKITFIKGRE